MESLAFLGLYFVANLSYTALTVFIDALTVREKPLWEAVKITVGDAYLAVTSRSYFQYMFLTFLGMTALVSIPGFYIFCWYQKWYQRRKNDRL